MRGGGGVTYTLIQGDCLDVMATLEAGSIDAIVTDPPYGIGYASAWQTRLGGGHRINGASFGKDEFNADWIPEAYRVLRDDALFYCFTRWDVANQWRMEFEAVGFKTCQRLVWDKCHWKMGDLRYYGSQIEDILVFRKGNRPIFEGGKGRRGNLLRYSSAFLPEGQYDHPTQKPVALMKRLVADATVSEETILDPFAGSGSTGVACLQLGRSFIGCEIDPAYFAIAQKRISEAAMQPALFAVG